MKNTVIILILILTALSAQGQTALRQLESLAGRQVGDYQHPVSEASYAGDSFAHKWGGNLPPGVVSEASYAGDSFEQAGYNLGTALAQGLFAGIDWLIEKIREKVQENRAKKQAAREQGYAYRANATKYTRTSNYKLKDVKPVNAGKTLPAECGKAGDYSVYAKYDKKGNPKYGIKDAASKKWVYKPVSEGINIVSLHGATVTKDGKTGIIDPVTGKMVENMEYDKYRAFCYPDSPSNMIIGLGKTASDGKETWLLYRPDADGNYVTDGKEYADVRFFEDGTGQKIMYMEKGGQVGLMNGKGESVLPPVFDGLANLNYTVDNVAYYQAKVRSGTGAELKGVVDETGRSIIPCAFDEVDAKSFGSYGIKVESEGKQGVYDVEGYPILPPGFDKVELDHFYDGQKHRAFYRGYTTDAAGNRISILTDTHGNPLTEFVTGIASPELIKDQAEWLEEYRI